MYFDYLKEREKEIDEFVEETMKRIEEEKVDLAYYEYMLNQLRNKIEFYLKFYS